MATAYQLFCVVVLLMHLMDTAAKREKIARISPLKGSSFSTKAGTSKKMGKGKKGSLNLQDLHSLGLSQVSSINISFFEGESTHMLFTWTDSAGNNPTDHDHNNNRTWYGEASNGLGSITIIIPHPLRFAGYVA